MGCIAAKLEWCVVAKCCHCIHLRLGCFIIAAIAIVFWFGVTLFFLLDDGQGFLDNVDHASWVSRAYITAMLIEAAARVVVSIILIFGAAIKHVKILTIFLVAWIVLVILVLGDLIFAIAISHIDGATIVFGLAYTAGRFLFSVLAVVIVNSYRLQLIDEHKKKEKRSASPELVF